MNELLLKQLAESSERLNAKTEQLNDTIRGVEERLNETCIGVVAWVDPGSISIHPYVLGYKRHKDRWCLVAKRREDSAVTPLLCAPREVRVNLAPFIGDLVSELIKNAEKLLEQMPNRAPKTRRTIKDE